MADGWEGLRGLRPGPRGLESAARAIRAASPRHTGVYLYALEGEELALRAFSGRPTEHTRIRVADGVCGRAVAAGEDQVVEDVGADPDYISCSLATRSECVVLVRRDGRVVGEIDIDSDAPGPFPDTSLRDLRVAAGLIAHLF